MQSADDGNKEAIGIRSKALFFRQAESPGGGGSSSQIEPTKKKGELKSRIPQFYIVRQRSGDDDARYRMFRLELDGDKGNLNEVKFSEIDCIKSNEDAVNADIHIPNEDKRASSRPIPIVKRTSPWMEL